MTFISVGMGGPAEKATLIRYKPESFVRFRWEEDEGTKYFFEMTLSLMKLPMIFLLNITDFCEKGDEETRLYWDNLIENLQIKLGAA